MARSCTVCAHLDRGEIDAELDAGASLSQIAARYGLSRDALHRHRHRHQLAEATAPRDHLDPLDELVTVLRERMLAGDPRATESSRLALVAQRAAGRDRPPPTPLVETGEWIQLRERVLVALAPYPEARQAVAYALEAV